MEFNFVSIPRTGSQTVYRVLNISKENNHKSISQFKNKDLFTFAFFRNPIDRLESWFYFHKKKYKNNPEVNCFYDCSYIQWIVNGMTHHWSAKACDYLGIKNPLRQFDFISINGKLQKMALLHFENFNSELNRVLRYLKIYDEDLNIPRTGISHKPTVNYPFEIKKEVEKFLEKDLNIYETIHSSM